MKREQLLLFWVAIVVLGLSLALLVARPQNSNHGLTVATPEPSKQEDKLVEYKVGRVIRSSNKPYEVSVIISVDPKYFIRDTMVKLARQLKEDFADERLLRVEILDDQNIADNYIPAGPMYRSFYKAKRGTYVLNRNTGRERLEFSTARGKPTNEVKIDLSKDN
jgi:hypothetical protein